MYKTYAWLALHFFKNFAPVTPRTGLIYNIVIGYGKEMQGVDEDISKWEENDIFHSPATMVSYVINVSTARNSHFQ